MESLRSCAASWEVITVGINKGDKRSAALVAPARRLQWVYIHTHNVRTTPSGDTWQVGALQWILTILPLVERLFGTKALLRHDLQAPSSRRNDLDLPESKCRYSVAPRDSMRRGVAAGLSVSLAAKLPRDLAKV